MRVHAAMGSRAMSVLAGWLVAAGVACTPSRRPDTPQVASAAPMSGRPAVVVDERLGWFWLTDPTVGDPATGRAEPIALPTPGGDVQVFQGDDARVEYGGWRVDMTASGSNRVAAAVEDESVYAVRFHANATGATAVALALGTGAVAWSVPLYGAGPIDHSRYANRVQVATWGRYLEVYGWESGGAYVERVDTRHGRVESRKPVPAELAALAWAWDGDPDALPEPAKTIAVGGFGDVGLEARGVVLPGGRRLRLWDREIDPTGAAVLHGGIVYVATASAIATGARLTAIEAASAHVLWSRRLHGIGNTAHSQYSNALQIAWAHDCVIVTGNEANGRYVEAVDPASGRTIVNKTWLR